MKQTERHLEGKAEYLYDYKYDTLVLKMKDRNYKRSFEFQNFVADLDEENFVTGIRILDASTVFEVDKPVLKHIIHGKFKTKMENNVLTVVFRFVSKVRNRVFPLFTENENFTQQITQVSPVKVPDSLVEAPIAAA